MELSEQYKKAARTALQKIVNTYNVDIVQMINCTVISVDKSARTCVVQPISSRSDTEIQDVGLMPERNDGEYKIPSIGSTVGVIMSTHVDPYIVSWSDLDEWYLVIGTTTIDIIGASIKFGDGSFGGLIKIENLVSDLNGQLSALQAAITAAFTAQAPIDASAGLNAWNAAKIAIQPLNTIDIENTQITHGTT